MGAIECFKMMAESELFSKLSMDKKDKRGKKPTEWAQFMKQKKILDYFNGKK